MMTLILVVSVLLIAFIGLLRYDIHKHKHRDSANNTGAAQPAEADEQHPEKKA